MTRCCPAYGSGDFRPARVTETLRVACARWASRSRRAAAAGSSAPPSTRTSRAITATTRRQQHLTYLMWRRDKGFRVGTTRTRPAGQHPQAHGLQIRSSQEHADAAWVLSMHDTEAGGPRRGAAVRAQVRDPDAAVRRPPGAKLNGLVHDQALIDRVFAGIDTYAHGMRLLRDSHLDFKCPHHVPLSFEGRRRNVTLTLCGDRRGRGRCTSWRSAAATRRPASGSSPPGSRSGRPSAARRAGATSRASATSAARSPPSIASGSAIPGDASARWRGSAASRWPSCRPARSGPAW